MNILPDSRTKGPPKDVKFGKHPLAGVTLAHRHIYCANCGKDQGFVPDLTEFVFVLCDPCGEQWGTTAHTWTEPEELFWIKVERHLIETYGHLLSHNQVAKLLDDNNRQLTQLLREKLERGRVLP